MYDPLFDILDNLNFKTYELTPPPFFSMPSAATIRQ